MVLGLQVLTHSLESYIPVLLRPELQVKLYISAAGVLLVRRDSHRCIYADGSDICGTQRAMQHWGSLCLQRCLWASLWFAVTRITIVICCWPLQGSCRYDLVDGRWIYKHDGHTFQGRLADELQSITGDSVDLDQEPQVAKGFVGYGADPTWWCFLSGDPHKAKRLWKSSGLLC